MPRAKARLDEVLAQLFDELQGALTQRNVGLHLKGTRRMYLLCTSKRLTMCCRFNGSGAGVRENAPVQHEIVATEF